MKVAVFVKATKSSEAGEMPTTELMTAMGNYNEELVKAGVMLSGEGLHPSSKGARVRFSGSNRTVIDGPFSQTNELVAGFWLWKVRSLEEAIDWVKKCPNPMMEDSEIEIRPVFEADDFGDAFTPELREQEAALRAQALGLNAPAFVDGPAMIITGLNVTYTMESRSGIPQQWERFVPRMRAIPVPNDCCYGVCWNPQEDCAFDYLTGVEATATMEVPADFVSVELPARRYAVFPHTTHVSAIPKTIDTIWSNWVPECGLKVAHTPCFERYTAEFDPQTGLGGTEIWVPLE